MSEQKQEVLSHELLAAIGDYGHAKYRHDNDIITLGAWEDLITAIKVWNRSALAAKDARIAELEAYICYADEVSTCAEQLLKMIQIDACDVTKDMVAVLRLDAALKELESFDNTCADGDATATPSEDGREVDDFASVLRDEIQRVFDYGRQNYRGCMNETIEQLQVQHSRIVAAKDADIAQLRRHKTDYMEAAEETRLALQAEVNELRAQPARPGRAPEHSAYEAQRCALAKLLGAFRDAPKDADQAAAFTCADELFNATTGVLAKDAVQPARQVGGDEPVAWHTDDHLDDKSATTYDKVVAERWVAKGWPVTPLYRAALAPAAVVMPERRTDANYPTQLWREAAGWNAALDKVARLNRNAIPVELLERIANAEGAADWNGCDWAATDELRALLGKEEGGQ